MRKRINNTALAIAKMTVKPSTRAALPSSYVTTPNRASDATFTPFKNAPAVAECRIRGTGGPLIATKKKAGRKISNVATSAPSGPPST